jgi:oligopeptide/dipeptide ABC transporter ATP-binding protein
LDVTTQAQILDLLRSLQRELGTAMVLVSHDLSLLSEFCSRAVVMYAGQVIEEASTQQLIARPRHPYSEALLNASLLPEDRSQLLMAIPGLPPLPGAFPSGCRFSPRCPYAEDRCSSTEPVLSTLSGGNRVRCLRHAELTLVVRAS